MSRLRNNRVVTGVRSTPPDETPRASRFHLIYFAPADIQIARVDRNCIVKFCEALAAKGARVTLVSQRIKVLETEPTATRTIWDVFGVRHKFELVSVRLPMRQERLDTRLASVIARPARALTYPVVAARLLMRGRRVGQVPVLYAKNHGLLPMLRMSMLLRRRNSLLLFEAHVPPHNRFQDWAMGRADGIVCNGHAIHRVMLERGLAKPNRSIAVHQGFSQDAYPDGDRAEARKHARRRLGWNESDGVAAYTGKVYWPYAEVELLLQAASHLAPDGIRMVIVGGREDHVAVWRDEAVKRGVLNVVFEGFIAPSRIVDYQVAADVLISYYPSGIELNDYRSPGKLFEYMASRTPIVAADYASLREVLEDGRNAILIEPDRPRLLAEAIRRLVGDPVLAARLGVQAREDAASYTWASRAETISSFVSSLENK